jgi:7-cyano-7-deazaguanine synthase
MKTIVIASGGLDSSVLLYMLRNNGHELTALSFDYGQRHHRELAAAADIADGLGIAHQQVDLTSITPLIATSSQTNPAIAVPDGHYAEESMKATVVPNRNMMMLSVGIARAIAGGYQTVAYGAHGGDHAIYPDCREQFVLAMDAAAQLADWTPVNIVAPFLGMSKARIVNLGFQLHVPFERTWSCYKGLEMHCGVCGTCVERREAFALGGHVDPTPYQEENR